VNGFTRLLESREIVQNRVCSRVDRLNKVLRARDYPDNKRDFFLAVVEKARARFSFARKRRIPDSVVTSGREAF